MEDQGRGLRGGTSGGPGPADVEARQLCGWASQGTTGQIGRPNYAPSATLHRLSESGRNSHAHRRAVGQIVSSAPGRSRGGPTSRSGDVQMLPWSRAVSAHVCRVLCYGATVDAIGGTGGACRGLRERAPTQGVIAPARCGSKRRRGGGGPSAAGLEPHSRPPPGRDDGLPRDDWRLPAGGVGGRRRRAPSHRRTAAASAAAAVADPARQAHGAAAPPLRLTGRPRGFAFPLQSLAAIVHDCQYKE